LKTTVFKIWRGDANGGGFKEYKTEISEGMVVLDAVHDIQRTQATDLACRWNCKAGKCGSCSAEVNGMPKLMCMARMSDLPLDRPITIEPIKAFPVLKDLITDVSWNFQVKKKIKPFKPRARCARWDLADATGGYRPSPGIPEVHRMFPLSGRLPRFARPPDARSLYRAALFDLRGRARDASVGY